MAAEIIPLLMCSFMPEPHTRTEIQSPHISRRVVWVLWLSAVGFAGCQEQPTRPKIVTDVKSDAAIESPSRPTTLIQFTEVAETSGVRFVFRDGSEAGNYAILESLGGGAALFDFDGDGALDIFLPGGGGFQGQDEVVGRSGALFRNLGNRTFQEVTRSAGVSSAHYYSHGVAAGDYNSDGFPDLLVTGYGGL
ncbi:MAG TPA: VCBS repeat-containing protein, partial [Planctomycetaceae bacterium]|nr:VCBS repeat-containing protein [Planctomycetaceae bacterium]